jgi:dolichol-phosphate mannosyltransferase
LSLRTVLNTLKTGTVYLVVDNVSKDNTLELCRNLSNEDSRFVTVWSPENKNVVDAYLAGYRTAINHIHEYIIEMDAGLSHDPNALPAFLEALSEGYDCVFGSRFIAGGAICDSNWIFGAVSWRNASVGKMNGTCFFIMPQFGKNVTTII